jgi:phosphoglycerate kinase
MIFTFFKARGYSVGKSMVEDSQVDLARQLVAKAAEKGVKLLLPTDIIVADKYAADAQTQVVSAEQIPDGWMVSCSLALRYCCCFWTIKHEA